MEAVQELLDALVDEGVMGDVVGPLLQLPSGGQLAAQDQVGSLQIIALLGQLLDWIAAVAQDAGVAINESDAALAQRRIVERRVVTHQAEIAPVGLDLAQVQSADGAIFDGEFVLLTRAVVGDAERLPARRRRPMALASQDSSLGPSEGGRRPSINVHQLRPLREVYRPDSS